METTTSSLPEATTSIQRNKILYIPLIVAFALAVLPVQALATDFDFGFFENLVVAIDPDGDIIGRYEESQGEGVAKNCSFFLKGKARSGKANVITWSNIALPGVLTAAKGSVELKVPQGREHAGCGLVLLPQIDEGMPLDLLQRTKWVDLITISSQRAELYSNPDVSGQPVGDFPRGTTVGVLAEKDGWYHVESTHLGERKKGWIRRGQGTKPVPPASQ